jgi:hypothetical protein
MQEQIVTRVTGLNFVKLFVSFCRFSLQMKTEKHLLWKGPLELMKQMLTGRSVVAFHGWKIVCHVTLWHLAGDWYECGTMWTDSKFRRQGLAERVMSSLILHGGGKRMILTSTNIVSQKLAKTVGFESISFHDLPSEVHRETCICGNEKTGVSDQLRCTIKNRKCICFVLK